MAAPVLQDYTMRRGALTLANAGGASLSQFMFASGGAVTSWSIVGGDTTGLQIDTSTGAITPTINGGFGGANRSLTIRGTNVDGSDDATLTIEMVASAYSVASPTQVDSSSTGLRQASIRSALGGRTVIISRGTYSAFDGNGAVSYTTAFQCRFAGFNTHTGRFTIRSEFPENSYLSLSRLLFIGSTRIDVEDLGFETYLSIANTNPNNQNIAAISFTYTATFGLCSDITVSRCTMGAPSSATGKNQWATGVEIVGQIPSPYAKASYITITDCEVTRVKDGFRISNANNCTIDSCIISEFTSNASFWSLEVDNNTIKDCIVTRSFINAIDEGDHQDFNQVGGSWGATGVRANCNANSSIRNIFVVANGDGPPQGPFYDDVGYYDGVTTGFSQNNCSVQNIFVDTPIIRAISMDIGTGWDVQRSSMVLGDSWALQPTFEPWLSGPVAASGLATGICRDNFSFYRDEGLLYGFPDLDTDNTIAILPGSPPTTWTNDLRLSYLTPYFQDPGRVVDYASLTPAQIAAEIKEMYAPIEGGPLMNVDGTYRGSFFPDGTWNDGTVYEATPPSSIVSSAPVATAEVGEPVTVTFQLDANANQTVEINPSVSGVTGGFTPDPVTIDVGQGNITTSFVATSAGTATISAANNRSLSGPSNLVLTITSPAVDPTTYTQTLNSGGTTVGASVQITYVLDQVATADVIITPSSNLAGSFSSATVTIPFGSQSAQVTYTPSIQGTHVLSATNDSSLANPANANLLVATTNVAQLIVLGIRPSL